MAAHHSKDRGTHGQGTLTPFETAVDIAVRPASYQPSRAAGIWPRDRQGYTLISHADTEVQWKQYGTQWVKHEATFVAPADKARAQSKHSLRAITAHKSVTLSPDVPTIGVTLFCCL